MKKQYHQLLKPELIKSISGLALIARVVVDGFSTGINRSKSVGAGMEFSQYRNYESGDDLRLLDWKMLARSGRYYSKQSEITSNIAVQFIIDASNSMSHQEDGLSKMDMSKVLVASLAYVSKNQGDAVGLFAVNEKRLYDVYPKTTKQQYNRLLEQLITIEAEGKWPKNADGLKKIHNRNQKELIFFVTDLYEHDTELLSFVNQLKNSRNEVVVLHIMGNKELTFDYKGLLTFEDLETGARRKVDTKLARKDYLSALEVSIKGVKEALLSNQIDYHLFDTKDHIGETLQLFLKKRNKLV